MSRDTRRFGKSDIELIIFDLDGVLVEACNWHRDAFLQAVKELLKIDITIEEHDKIYNGLPTKVKLEMLGCIKDMVELINDRKQKLTIELIHSKCKQTETYDLLRKLHHNPNRRIGCYTNSIRETTRLMLHKSNIDQFFDCILTNQDVIYPKPNPEGYIKIMNLFNIPKAKTLIVEDSDKGIEAAKQSGANVLEVLNPVDTIRKLNEIYFS